MECESSAQKADSLTLLAAVKPMPNRIVLQANTFVDLQSSRPARVWGTIVVVITVLLYSVF